MTKNNATMRRRAASEASLKRRNVERKPVQRILIACEGEETEKRYFEAFIASLKMSGVDVEICGEECDSAPISVVEFAEEKARREGSSENGGYKMVFCVFDRDTHETYEKALQKIGQLNSNRRFPTTIAAVTSIPCIEFWFILHFRYSRAPFHAVGGKSVARAVIDELKKIPGFEKYEKAISAAQSEILISKIENAVQNARKGQKDCKLTGEANPSTDVDKLIKYVRDLHESIKEEAKKSM